MIGITETDPALFGGAGGGGNSEKLEKNEVFLTYERSNRILMKFDIWKDIVSQNSYCKSRPNPVTFGGS